MSKVVRQPKVVALDAKAIQVICPRLPIRYRTFQRWYVVIDFGGVKKKLAVSGRVAKWLQGRRKTAT